MLKLSLLMDWALRYRYLTIALAGLLVISGIFAFKNLSMEAYPDFTNPLVRVITLYPGKGSEEVEKLITIPLEKELNGIPGETNLRSASLFGLSVTYVTFQEGTESFRARQQVLERIQKADLPEDAKPELDPDASPVGEIYRYTVNSKYYDPMNIKAIEDWQLEKAFRQIPGVVDVTGFGGPVKTYQVSVNPGRLRAYKLSILDVLDALSRSNNTTGGNYINTNGQAYIVRGLGLLSSLNDLKNVVIATSPNGTPICVKDVANIATAPGLRLGQVGKNYDDDVIQGIVLMRRGENPSNVIEGLYRDLPKIQANLPEGIKLIPLYDRMELIRRTLDTVSHNVAEGVILVIIVLLLFLYNARAAFIASTVIPLSLLFAFLMLNIFKVPANLLSLGAIDFGIIVDSTVIMVEHILHELESKGQFISYEERLALVDVAAKDVGRPILYATMIIAVAFLPIFAFDGVAGKLFRPLAFTMNFALMGAVLIAITVIPVLCSIFLTPKPLSRKDSPILVFIEQVYQPILFKFLKHPKPFTLSLIFLVLLSIVLFTRIGTEFLPSLDEGNIWLRVTVLPSSVALEDSVKIAREIRNRLIKYPEVKNIVSQIGSPDDGTDPNNPSNIEFLIDLNLAKEWREKWHGNKVALTSAMSKELSDIPGILTNFSQYIQDNVDEAIAGAKGQIVVKIFGPDLAVLQSLGNKISRLFNQVPGMVDIATDKLTGQPQYQIQIDRSKADRYGINILDITRVIETAIGGKLATQILEGEKRFKVIVRFSKDFRNTEQNLRDILITAQSGLPIPLSEVSDFKSKTGAITIYRSDNSRVIVVKGNVRNSDLGSVVRNAQKLVQQTIKLPIGYSMKWSGQFENQQRANNRMMIAIPLTVILIFLLLLITFRNLKEAVIGLLPIPLTLIGGVLALLLTHTYFSVSAGVGFIAAMGVSVQNGVVMLSYSKQLMRNAVNPVRVGIKAARAKIRPVIMAGTVAILGLIPAALSHGIGSQSQKPFALVIIGGLLSATFLTVFAIPVIYILSTKNRKREQK